MLPYMGKGHISHVITLVIEMKTSFWTIKVGPIYSEKSQMRERHETLSVRVVYSEEDSACLCWF
jgi:hypothetical protein